jgi:hypothetical protein
MDTIFRLTLPFLIYIIICLFLFYIIRIKKILWFLVGLFFLFFFPLALLYYTGYSLKRAIKCCWVDWKAEFFKF